VKTMDNDKRLMARAKTLNTQLQGERTRLAGMGSAGDDRTGADLLREDAEAAESEAALCRDREQILQLEVSVNPLLARSSRSALTAAATQEYAEPLCFPFVGCHAFWNGSSRGESERVYTMCWPQQPSPGHCPLCCGREGWTGRTCARV
jgi:hypothetical protein